MATVDGDCSQDFCTIYCPQWCYHLFPPPSFPLTVEDSSFSPLVISIIAVLASALLVVSYYAFASKYCASIPFLFNEDAGGGAEEWHMSIPSINGLTEALISKIRVRRYKSAEGLVEGKDCSVCLGEFSDGESLRILPKCGHAFHLPCIDTWLKSQASCPLCRESIVVEENIEEAERSIEEIGEEEREPMRRCSSTGSMSEQSRRVSIGDVLQRSIEEEYMVAKDFGLAREEQTRGGAGRMGLRCVLSTARMKRSVSSGRFFSPRRGRESTSLLLLPV